MRSLALLVSLLSVACSTRSAATEDASTHLPHLDAARLPPPADVLAPDRASDASRACTAWSSLGLGVSEQRCPSGEGPVLVVLAGWRITLPSAQGWAEGLRRAHPLLARSRASFAVQGPEQVDFRDKELAVDALLAALEARSAQAPAVLVVAHSSGAFVAATLFDRALRQGRAPGLAGRLAYVDLDGDRPLPADPERSLGPRTIAGLRGALFVAVEDATRGLRGFSHPVMESEARHLGAAGHLLRYDASNAGCTSNTCAHLALVRSVPRATGNESYASTREGGANVAWMAPVERWLSP